MIKEGKVWGQTIPLLQSPAVEIHRITVEHDMQDELLYDAKIVRLH
jgi:hypothetical protein